MATPGMLSYALLQLHTAAADVSATSSSPLSTVAPPNSAQSTSVNPHPMSPPLHSQMEPEQATPTPQVEETLDRPLTAQSDGTHPPVDDLSHPDAQWLKFIVARRTAQLKQVERSTLTLQPDYLPVRIDPSFDSEMVYHTHVPAPPKRSVFVPTLPPHMFTLQPNSALLHKLPGELRNKIIRLAIVKDEGDQIPIKVEYILNKAAERSASVRIEHPLMQTCKQLRYESSDIFFLENTFCITDDLFHSGRGMHELTRQLKPWASKMSRLNVSHTLHDNDDGQHVGFHRRKSTTHIQFSLSRHADRQLHVAFERMEVVDNHVIIHMVDDDDAAASPPTVSPLCCCNIARLAELYGRDGLPEWVKKYSSTIKKSKVRCKLSYCWECGLRPMV